MTFSSLEFIFRFMPVFLIAFYLTPARLKKGVLLAGSLLFYGVGAPKALPLLVGMAAVNAWIGCRVTGADKSRMSAAERKRANIKNKRYFIAGTGLDAVVLLLGKALFPGRLPLGLSFYSFKMISYQADCYRGRIGAHGWLDAWGYFCLFPQLISGPVMRFDGWERLKLPLRRKAALARLEAGLFYFTAGLGAKVLLADRLGLLWHDLETIGFESISTPLAWLGAAGYSLQLYLDFAGYSLMAAGLGVMLGLPFIQNFSHPYASRSIREFFRRWHSTLGSWFRDYVYIPLGGSRRGRGRCFGALALVWFLTGLWHGSSVNFLLWGLFLFLLVAAEKFCWGKALEKHRLAGHLYVLCLMPVAWVLFAIPDLHALGVYLGRMFPAAGTGGVVYAGDFQKYASQYVPYLAASALCCVPGVTAWFEKRRLRLPVALLMTAVFWCSVYRLSTAALNPFLYFSF